MDKNFNKEKTKYRQDNMDKKKYRHRNIDKKKYRQIKNINRNWISVGKII